jgi:phage shock protein C
MNISDEIKRLHELHQAGALSDAEFEQAKAKLLNASVDLNKSSGGSYSSNPSGSSAAPDIGAQIQQLRRSRSDRWLGGVCGGLGKQTGLESWVWRLIFTLFTLTFGFGLGVYILMWIFVPEE